MTINYKKELENAANNMILVHNPNLLIKTIVDMVVQKIKVDHASILLRQKNSYILTVSQGSLGSRIPVGFARIDKENPLIVFFKSGQDKLVSKYGVVLYEEAAKISKKGNLRIELRTLLKYVLYQMETFDSKVSIPIYFRDDLLGILLLGKKENGKKFRYEELNFFTALASNVAMAIRNAQLFKELELELEKKRQLFMRTTIALAAAIEAKDHYMHGHTTRVTNLSLEIARKISQKNKKPFNEKTLEDIQIASLLHDIGKIGVPEYILNKEGPLTKDERDTINEHPLIGVAILKSIKELDNSLLGVKYHHEKYDGSGYPEGLRGDQIPMIASIISVADSFDAMTSNRPYRYQLSKPDAIAEIKNLTGKQFDPRVTGAFLEICQEKRI